MRFIFCSFLSVFLFAQSSLDSSALAPQQSFSPTQSESIIDSKQLEQYSKFTYRYNTRIDKTHNIELFGVGGSANIMNSSSYYGGGVFKYDGLVDRFPLGFITSYTYQGYSDSPNTQSHNIQLGFYSDVFVESHRIKLQIIQSMNLTNINQWLSATTTNANLEYGYVFAFGSAGSFLQPLVGANMYSLFNVDSKSISLPNYALNVHLDFGVRYQQFITKALYFYITPIFRQDIGVIHADPLARIVAINTDGSIEFASPDDRYRSYGNLKAGLDYRFSKSLHLALNFDGKLAYKIRYLSANLALKILF